MSHGAIDVYSLSGNKELADKVSQYLKTKLGKLDLHKFKDGEYYARFENPIRGKDVYIIQSLSNPVNDCLMELLVVLDAAKRSSPNRLTVILPYYAYARQDRQNLPHEPITAKLIADLIKTAGANRIVTIDLHSVQVQGFFDGPFEHLTAMPVIAHYIERKKIKNLVVVAPDMGAVKLIKKYSDKLKAEFVTLHKSRTNKDKVSCDVLFGDVEGKNCIVIDDLISTGSTLIQAAEKLKDCGAATVRVVATHGLFAGDGFSNFANSSIDEVIVTDTLKLGDGKGQLDNLKVLSVAGLIGEAIKRLNTNKPLEDLF